MWHFIITIFGFAAITYLNQTEHCLTLSSESGISIIDNKSTSVPLKHFIIMNCDLIG